MVLAKLFGTKSEREMKKLEPTKDKINQFYETLSSKTDEDLVSKLMELIQNNGSININRLIELASQFDWGIIATKYDSLILKVYENRK